MVRLSSLHEHQVTANGLTVDGAAIAGGLQARALQGRPQVAGRTYGHFLFFHIYDIM